MPKPKRDELKAGICVLAALAILLGVIIWLGAGEIFGSQGQDVVFYIPLGSPGAGVGEGAAIAIGGAEVGQITSVEFRPDLGKTLYRGKINRKDVVIHADGSVIAVSGLVGGGALAVISTGTEDAPLADEDNPVRIAGGMEQAMANLTDSTRMIKETLERELDAEDSESVLGRAHGIMTGLETSAENVAVITANIALETDREIADSLVSQLHVRMEEAGGLVRQLDLVGGQIESLLSTGQEMVGKINQGEGTLGALLNDARLYKGLLDSIDEMGLLLEDVRAIMEQWKESGVPLNLK